ncbi:hypothetical protein TWF481_000928 [Arthrobotrys musiformis]|uniref:Uncharacterized protein n=1 Tax=Arthrobotrys musiformis TaxID=47236 RepID=A0AAV9WRA5_9PEZI
MATPQNHPPLVIKAYETITFAGNDHIQARQGQRIELVARRGDILEITFPSPSSRQVVRMSMNSKSVTIYWTESTGSLILYINDKHSASGYPKVTIRNEIGFRGWSVFSNDANIHADMARLLGTQEFGNHRLIGLKWNRFPSSLDQKPLRKAICHTKWQNVSSIELRRRCKHMLEDAGMNYEYFFGSGPAAGPSATAGPRAQTGANAPAGGNASTTANTRAPTGANTPAGGNIQASTNARPGTNVPGNAQTGANVTTVANTPTVANAPAVANTTTVANAPAVANASAGATTTAVPGAAVATTTTTKAANTTATTTAPTATNNPAGANTSTGPQGTARPAAPTGPTASSVALAPPPKQQKRPVSWSPLTALHLIKVLAPENRVYNPITPKPRGTIRPPAVFHFDDSDPFGTVSSGSRVATQAPPMPRQAAPPASNNGAQIPGSGTIGQARAQVAGQGGSGVRGGPPPLPPLPSHLTNRPAAATTPTQEATESLAGPQGNGTQYLAEDKIRSILAWQRGQALAEAEETPLPGPPSGLLIDFGGDPEVSAPEGGVWGGRSDAEELEAMSELAGLEFGDGSGVPSSRTQPAFPRPWGDLEGWNIPGLDDKPPH